MCFQALCYCMCGALHCHVDRKQLQLVAAAVQTRGGQLTVKGVLQYIWQHEGFVGLFK
jgi:transcriptional/translational regulatory protein YebC/TACO1